MSHQTTIDKVCSKTGKTIEEIVELTEQKGLFDAGTKAGKIVEWLDQEFNLGQGLSMALYGVFKDMGLIKPLIKIESKPKVKYQSRKRE